MDVDTLTLSTVEARAAEALDPPWRDYVAGGAGAERTLRANVAAFGRHRLRQRVLAGIEAVDLRATVLGLDLGFPVLSAPVAYQRALHAEGEEGLARACDATGAGYCLSTFSNATPAEIAAAAPGVPRLHQVYVFRDHAVTDELTAQALAAGFTGILLTVDLPAPGMRDRERLHQWGFVDDELPAIVHAHERGVGDRGVDVVDPALDWDFVEAFCSRSPVPVVVKGILEPEDARRAADRGAAGVVVSNHGGRQLDPARASLDALPDVVAAVGDRIDVLFDGGVRRGSDIAAALALGARAVLCGRLPVWGLAAGGTAGAQRVLELLREELELTLRLMGRSSVAELSGADLDIV